LKSKVIVGSFVADLISIQTSPETSAAAIHPNRRRKDNENVN